MGKEIELQSYNDYPESVSNNAQKGIDANEKNDNKCATAVGKLRAQQLAQRKDISLETIKRMYSYLSRAESFYNESDPNACGTISFLLWGGKSALEWSKSKLKELGEIELEGEGGTTTSISSSYTGQFGGPTKKKKTKVKLQVEAPNLDVFGYPTKHFEICPGAQAFFQKLVSVPPTEDNVGMIRSMAQMADNVFEIEKDVLQKEKATPEQLQTAMVLVEDFYDVLEEVQEGMLEESGIVMDLNADFMNNHLNIISKYVA
jgi:hypothetical protein